MRKKHEIPIKVTAALAMLSAISIIAGKYLAIPGGEVLRFSFENLPIIFAGIAFGPIAAMLVGACADLLGCLLVGYSINPLVTLGAIVIGAIGGSVWQILKKIPLPYLAKIVITVLSAHLIGSVIIKTIGLAAYYSMPLGILMLWRLLNYAIIGTLEIAVLYVLMKNRLIIGAVAKLTGKVSRDQSEDEK